MPEADLIFVSVVLVSIVIVVILLWGKGEAIFRSSQQQLLERGYVITHAYQRDRGSVTWVWGRYAEPVPFYIHLSNRDPIAAAAGRLGISDMTTGYVHFDDQFVVRSNKPDWAKEFLTKELCEELGQFENLQFLTSSIGNVLTPDYWPDLKTRNLRDIWMLRVDGKLESPAVDRYVDLARRLSTEVLTHCSGRASSSTDRVTPMFEGR